MTIDEFNAVWEKAYQSGYSAAKLEGLKDRKSFDDFNVTPIQFPGTNLKPEDIVSTKDCNCLKV